MGNISSMHKENFRSNWAACLHSSILCFPSRRIRHHGFSRTLLQISACIDACESIINVSIFYTGEFDDLLSTSETGSDSGPTEEISREFCYMNNPTASNGSLPLGSDSSLLTIKDLTLLTPSKSTLIRDLSLEICEKGHLLVSIRCFIFKVLMILGKKKNKRVKCWFELH